MRKFSLTLIALLITLSVGLTACLDVQETSSNEYIQAETQKGVCQVNEDVEKVATKSLEIIDAYLDLKISADEADERFESLFARMETMSGVAIDDYEAGSPNYDVLGSIENAAQDIHFARSDTIIEAHRDKIAYRLGVALRKVEHPAQKYFYNYSGGENKEAVYHACAVEETDFRYCDVFYDDETKHSDVTVYYDMMNGLDVGEFIAYAEKISGALSSTEDISGYWLCLRLDCYGEEVMYLEAFGSQSNLRILVFADQRASVAEYGSWDELRNACLN